MPYDIIIGRDKADKEKFKDKGLIYIGKGYVTMGNYTSLSNLIWMDVARSHVILIAGKRGSGKCLSGDSLINLSDGSSIPIKDLEHNNKKIFSLNNKLKIQSSEKTEFFDREVNKMLRVKLRSGKEIKLTPEHPLLTLKGWQPVKELKIGSRIATPRTVPQFGNNIMPEHEIKLLAYLIAEGHTKKVVLFANSDKKIVEDFRNSLNKFDSSLRLIKEKENHYRISSPNWKIKILKHNLERNQKGQFIKGNKNIVKKRSIRKLIEREELFGLLATEKYLSQNIMRLKKEQLSLFLNRLFSCDGSIYKHKAGGNYVWEISYSSSSKRLIKQVQNLLLRFGILSRLRNKKVKCNDKIFESFELVLNSLNVLKFIKQIGFFGEKEKRINEAINEINSKIKNPNIDTIPKEIWEIYRPKNWAKIGRYVGYKHPKAMRERIRYSPSRQTLLQIAEVEQNNTLHLLATSDIFWDEIMSIEILEGNFKVYDLCVPENHNFIANDIIVHNSYSIGVLAEELSDLPEETKKNIAPLIFDTMGIFWTMKYKNEKEINLLEKWELKPKNLPANIWAPAGYFDEYEKRGIPVNKKFALSTSELDIEDWLSIFNLQMTEPISILIQKTISELKISEKFDLDNIIEQIKKDKDSSDETKKSATSLFEAAKSWKVFAKKNEKPTKISELIQAGKTTVLDLSAYSSTSTFNVRALIIGLVSKKLFNQRMLARKKEEIQSIQHGVGSSYEEEKEMPLVWLFIDECLTGNTEIITDKAHTPIQKIVNRFEKGEKFKVLGYDNKTNKYDHYNITQVCKKGKRKIMKLITETGREIKCTPEHRVLTSKGCFASAFSVEDIAFPLIQHHPTNPKLIEARILGHLFGDGWIYDKGKTLGFSGKGNRGDLEKIRRDLSILGFKSANIYERKTESKINHKGKIIIVEGLNQSFCSTNAYKHFREKAGFSGTKAINKINIPEYLFHASNLEKAEFLAALMGSDGKIISNAKNAGGDFNAIRFSFNKIESLEKEAFEYANQIKKLFEDVGVKVSSISKKEGNLRKDGHKTIKVLITLAKNLENTIKFLEKVGYRYCSRKEIEGLKWLEYLKARLFLKKQREKIKEKALELHSQGLGKIKISRKLKFPEAQIRDWIYFNMSPGLPKSFPDFAEWIQKRIKDKILFERIFKLEEADEEEVYDISVERVHNFISNGLITHNCHEFLPKEEKTPASNALIQLLREGRQPGISLVLATQQPGVIHRDVMTQSDIIISHRLTNKKDLQALNEIMQTYLLENIQKSMNALPDLKGSAVILDDNSERLYPIRVRPRFTWHGGEAPTAVKAKEEKI